MAPSSERPHPAECGSQSTIPIAPASKLFSLAVEETLIEFLKTVLLIEFSVGLRVCKKAERFSTMVSYIRQDALAQHPAAEPLPLLVWLHSQQIQVPSLSAETVAGFHSHNVSILFGSKEICRSVVDADLDCKHCAEETCTPLFVWNTAV